MQVAGTMRDFPFERSHGARSRLAVPKTRVTRANPSVPMRAKSSPTISAAGGVRAFFELEGGRVTRRSRGARQRRRGR